MFLFVTTRKKHPAAKFTTFKLDSPIRARVQHLASTRNRSIPSLLAEAIETYVTHEEQQDKLIQARNTAREHYKKTGLYQTQEETEAGGCPRLLVASRFRATNPAR